MSNPLRDWREKRGKSVRELAELAAVNPATISKIENGHVLAQGRTLRKLADALDVPIEEFDVLRETGSAERGRAGGRASADKRKTLKDDGGDISKDAQSSLLVIVLTFPILA